MTTSKEPVDFWGFGVVVCLVLFLYGASFVVDDLSLQLKGERGYAKIAQQTAVGSIGGRRMRTGSLRTTMTTYEIYSENEQFITQATVVGAGTKGAGSQNQAIPILYDRTKPERFIDMSSEQEWSSKIFRDMMMTVLPGIYLLYRLSISPLFRKRKNQIEIFEGKSSSCCKK